MAAADEEKIKQGERKRLRPALERSSGDDKCTCTPCERCGDWRRELQDLRDEFVKWADELEERIDYAVPTHEDVEEVADDVKKIKDRLGDLEHDMSMRELRSKNESSDDE